MHYVIVHTKVREEQSKIYREKIIKREGEVGRQGAAANAWEDHDTVSKNLSGGNLGNGEG